VALFRISYSPSHNRHVIFGLIASRTQVAMAGRQVKHDERTIVSEPVSALNELPRLTTILGMLQDDAKKDLFHQHAMEVGALTGLVPTCLKSTTPSKVKLPLGFLTFIYDHS
jgi:hypothetical protein